MVFGLAISSSSSVILCQCGSLNMILQYSDSLIMHHSSKRNNASGEQNVTGKRQTRHWQVIDNPSIFHEECLVNAGCMQ